MADKVSAVGNGTGATTSLLDQTIRGAYAAELVELFPECTNRELSNKVREKFGMGVGSGLITDLKKARKAKKERAAKKAEGFKVPVVKDQVSLGEMGAPLVPQTVSVSLHEETNEELIKRVVGEITGKIKNLETLTITVAPTTGKVYVEIKYARVADLSFEC